MTTENKLHQVCFENVFVSLTEQPDGYRIFIRRRRKISHASIGPGSELEAIYHQFPWLEKALETGDLKPIEERMI